MPVPAAIGSCGVVPGWGVMPGSFASLKAVEYSTTSAAAAFPARSPPVGEVVVAEPLEVVRAGGRQLGDELRRPLAVRPAGQRVVGEPVVVRDLGLAEGRDGQVRHGSAALHLRDAERGVGAA